MQTAKNTGLAELSKANLPQPVSSGISASAVDDIDRHAPRYLFFAGAGEFQDPLGFDTGCFSLMGLLDGSRFTGHNVLASRVIVPCLDTPYVGRTNEMPFVVGGGAYDTTMPFIRTRLPDLMNTVRVARDAAEMILSITKPFGAVELVSLRGLEPKDANRVFLTVLPVSFAPYVDVKWSKEGLPENGEVNPNGTLIKLMEYLNTTSPSNIEAKKGTGIPMELLARGEECRQEMLLACNSAYLFEKNVYDQCDADMQTRRQTGLGKRAPDARDIRFSRDLELAAPDMKQIAEITAYGEQAAIASSNAIRELGGMMAQQGAMPSGVETILKQMADQQAQVIQQNKFLTDLISRLTGEPATPEQPAA